MKVLLILVDGMRSDVLPKIPEAQKVMAQSAYTVEARAVMPSLTLPCHMSLFHSVDPARHGTLKNTYADQARPIRGLCEVLLSCRKRSAFFYNWEQLRDIARPGSLTFSYYCSGKDLGFDKANDLVTDVAIQCLRENEIDFGFLYLGSPDDAGHKCGWMSGEYVQAVQSSWDNIERVMQALPEYTLIITADHGGHDRTHGTDLPEDMTIPVMITGDGIAPGELPGGASIKDLAPTVAKLLEVQPDEEWEGKSLL